MQTIDPLVESRGVENLSRGCYRYLIWNYPFIIFYGGTSDESFAQILNKLCICMEYQVKLDSWSFASASIYNYRISTALKVKEVYFDKFLSN